MLTLEGALIAQGTFQIRADMTLEVGQKYAVIGPSGAGKSTLLAALCGFLPLVEGRLLSDGAEMTQMAPGARPMTMLFQDNNLFPHLTVTQNVGLGLRPDMKLTSADRERVRDALRRVGLADQMEKRPAALSGGQQSRVALARVLVQARPWLLLDEPTSNLDIANGISVLERLREKSRQGLGVLAILHALNLGARYADRVLLLQDGKAAACGRPADVMTADRLSDVYRTPVHVEHHNELNRLVVLT